MLGRAFVWANFIPKIGAIGALYLAAPTRLCAYYRFDQQASAGWTLIGIAILLGTLWFLAAFIGWPLNAHKARTQHIMALPPPYAGS